ncbi:phospholipase D-like domain-containing protein [Candidatus Dependentiae bacterium]
MRINKKFLFIFISIFFIHFCLFSCQGPQDDLYKKNFIVDTEKNNVEDFIKLREGEISEAFFAPNADVQGLLIGLMKKEKSSMKMTIYSLRDNKIYNEILQARKRGVHVEIAFDAKFEEDRYEKKLVELEAKGAKVFVYKTLENKPHEHVTGIMHDKYVIFGKNIHGEPILWTGSFNFTHLANNYNQENVVIVNWKNLVKKYEDDFEVLKNDFCYEYVLNGDSDYVYESETDDDGDIIMSDVRTNKKKKKSSISGKRKRSEARTKKKKYKLRKRKRIDYNEDTDDEDFLQKTKKRKTKHKPFKEILTNKVVKDTVVRGLAIQ